MDNLMQSGQPSLTWVIFRHVAFWARWALLVLFIVPSVLFCTVLAIYSNWSFASVPREILQYAADTAKYPAAPNGYLTAQACADTRLDTIDTTARTPLVSGCNHFVLKQVSIEESAQRTGGMIWAWYILAVLAGAIYVNWTGLLTKRRGAFLASITGNTD